MRKYIAALAVALLLPVVGLAGENLPVQAVEKMKFSALPMSVVDQIVFYQADTANPWSPAYSPPTVNNSVKEVQGTTSPVTRTVPTIALVGRSAGLNLSNPQLPANQTGVAGVAVTVCAPSGATLSGAGTVEFYVYDSARSRSRPPHAARPSTGSGSRSPGGGSSPRRRGSPSRPARVA
jgi:hypothetical protein